MKKEDRKRLGSLYRCPKKPHSNHPAWASGLVVTTKSGAVVGSCEFVTVRGPEESKGISKSLPFPPRLSALSALLPDNLLLRISLPVFYLLQLNR